MARHCKEARLGPVGLIGLVAGVGQRALRLGAVSDVAPDALQLRRLAGIRANQALAPGDPARSERTFDLLVVNPRAVLVQRAVILRDDLKGKTAADQHRAWLAGHLAIGIVGKRDDAVGVAHHDEVALRFEQAAGASFRLLQFPIAIGKRLIVERDLAKPFAQKAQADA